MRFISTNLFAVLALLLAGAVQLAVANVEGVTCASWCDSHGSSWAVKCAWNDGDSDCGWCEPCERYPPPPGSALQPPPPPPPNCETTCTTNTNKGWDTKCNWGNTCGGCPECTAPSPPPNPPPPPLCHTRYVSPDGDDGGSGCEVSAPLLTIDACIDFVATSGTGGTCLLFPGTYKEGGMLTHKIVDGVTNLTIALAPSELWSVEESNSEAIIDGTVELDTSWLTHSDSFGTCTPRRGSEPLDSKD